MRTVSMWSSSSHTSPSLLPLIPPCSLPPHITHLSSSSIPTHLRENSIMCETSPSDVVSEGIIISVSVDNWMGDSAGFAYVADPTFESISPNISFAR